jgi:OPA family glycerol-3-phosphate transporter-like MFS transporter
MTLTFAIIYSINMFFQSYGAVSIIKVKAYWFHVRERGIFGGIFGTLISFGVYFAFDWGQAIADAAKVSIAQPTAFQNLIRTVFATDKGTIDATWLVFFIPAGILLFWAIVDIFAIQDSPAQANLPDFDTHDASSGLMDVDYSTSDLLKIVFSSPLIMSIAFIEFTTGVIRNGILQWYFIFAKEVPQIGAEYFLSHWGFLLCVTGIIAGFGAGHLSDKVFHSRRGPPAAIAGFIMLLAAVVMSVTIFSSPVIVGVCAVILCFLSIAIHALMSGTAAADFGGRKATATASGITDGFVYLGTGLQSISLGYLTTLSWGYWPAFIIPFAIISIFLAVRMWTALPEATRRYLLHVEKVEITTESGFKVAVETTEISESV